jgi:hypothetical protein
VYNVRYIKLCNPGEEMRWDNFWAKRKDIPI